MLMIIAAGGKARRRSKMGIEWFVIGFCALSLVACMFIMWAVVGCIPFWPFKKQVRRCCTCKYLTYYDWYRCGCGDVMIVDTINDPLRAYCVQWQRGIEIKEEE